MASATERIRVELGNSTQVPDWGIEIDNQHSKDNRRRRRSGQRNIDLGFGHFDGGVCIMNVYVCVSLCYPIASFPLSFFLLLSVSHRFFF